MDITEFPRTFVPKWGQYERNYVIKSILCVVISLPLVLITKHEWTIATRPYQFGSSNTGAVVALGFLNLAIVVLILIIGFFGFFVIELAQWACKQAERETFAMCDTEFLLTSPGILLLLDDIDYLTCIPGPTTQGTARFTDAWCELLSNRTWKMHTGNEATVSKAGFVGNVRRLLTQDVESTIPPN